MAAEEYMPKPVLEQFLTILHRHFTSTEPATKTMKNAISEYQRKELAILEYEWRQIAGDSVLQRPIFSTSSESSGSEFEDGDDEELDRQLEPSEAEKQPMMNQAQFIQGFLTVAKDTLLRMSSVHRRREVRALCDALKVGRKFRKRFNIIRVS